MFKIFSETKTIFKLSSISILRSLSRSTNSNRETNNIFYMPVNPLKKPFSRSLQNSNSVPNEYKIIYFCGNSSFLNAGHVCLIVLAGTSLWVISSFVREPEWLNRKNKIGIQNLHLGIAVFFYTVLLYFLTTRSIRTIFSNGKQFKSEFWGIFGPLKKKIVHHKASDIEGPRSAKDPFHYLRNRRIILHPECFLNVSDYPKVCKINDRLG